MPRDSYKYKLSAKQIIKLFDDKKYIADLETGNIYGKTGKPLFTFVGSQQDGKDNEDYLWTRLYSQPYYITIGVARVIWILGTRNEIPKNFEIHHEDENRRNNSFRNLYCLHKVDHRKKHTQPKDLPF